MYEFHFATESSGRENQDRILAEQCGSGRHLLILADGAGGIGQGGKAAEFVISEAGKEIRLAEEWNPELFSGVLRAVDAELASSGLGESTAVIIGIENGLIMGSSVGDSEGWMIQGQTVIRLTDGQQRKPLVGTGCARPRALSCSELPGSLLLIGSDGLFKYASEEKILQLASSGDIRNLAGRLIDLARLRSGALMDDTSVVVGHGVAARFVDGHHSVTRNSQ